MMINPKDNEISDDSLLYFGSHNFSPSAWGNQEKKDTQLHTANWELGIVFPPGKDTQALKRRIADTMVFNLRAPAQYNRPADEPFMLDKQFQFRSALLQ